MAERYDHKAIEKKWQEKWAADKLYATTEDPAKPKTYVLDMFPYPSGEGLHVGHPKGYIATDIYSRYKRMSGHNVLHPMGWDAFGLPAENFALKNKVHPRIAVEKNIAYFKEQLANIGFDYDWSREINTTDPAYYKWTQWIFLKLFEKGLAYQSNEPINWCPSCMTGLANEDLDGNVCERCGSVVEKKRLPQWVLKITAYADRMLSDLDALQWPEHIKEAQRNWIGRSEGAEIDFEIRHRMSDLSQKIKVFTTRPDTLFGATYLVLAPEVAEQYKSGVTNWESEVFPYIIKSQQKTEIERQAADKDKTGVELKGVKAINPATKEEIPMYVADYVLGGYGTGTIMAVPAHDERDYEFAQKFNIPVRHVVMPSFVDTANPPRDGKENTRRNTICGIVRNPKDGKFLVLKWKKQTWTTFVTGGVEDREDPVIAATREIAEETGYTNIRLARHLGFTEAFFYAAHKDVNRQIKAAILLFDLTDDTRSSVSAKESELHDVQWLTAEEVERAHMQHGEFRYIWDRVMSGEKTYTGPGVLINSGQFDGQQSQDAKTKITEFVGGRVAVQYKIKDWVFSRQRYWGEPIPIVHCAKDGVVAVPESDLPVKLPEVESYEPSGTGESPLAKITDWVNTTCPTCGGPGKRETNTMPQWAGSSWYYLRFCDPHNDKELAAKKKLDFWLGAAAPARSLGEGGVDVYVGGDHAVRHLIYARFWHKFLYDIGAVSTIEPFARLEFLGFILAEDGRKMSKRLGNVINPDAVVAEHGADTFRLYEMFMGPFENTVAWSTASMAGTRRFVERVWRLQLQGPNQGSTLTQGSPRSDLNALETLLHQTIKKVGEDIEAFKFNTAVSQMMIFLNAAEAGGIDSTQWKIFLRLLAPFAPHIAEELWAQAGERGSVHTAPWPQFDPAKVVAATATVAVQVNGKVRATVELAPDAPEDEALKAATQAVGKWLSAPVAKVIYRAGKVINLVV